MQCRSELSPDLSFWKIPADRMKNRKPHDVALPEAARAVLRDLPRLQGSDYVFTTTGKSPVSGFSKAKTRLDSLSGVSGWRLHDLRRTGVSRLAALGFDTHRCRQAARASAGQASRRGGGVPAP